MEIKQEYPPNYQDVLTVFPEAAKSGVLFCYGNIVYNPSGIFIPPHLIDHELVHSEQQTVYSPSTWWELYLSKSQFRLEQELIAHRKEWETYCRYNLDRNWQVKYLHSMAHRLSGPLYGNVLTFNEALRSIKE